VDASSKVLVLRFRRLRDPAAATHEQQMNRAFNNAAVTEEAQLSADVILTDSAPLADAR